MRQAKSNKLMPSINTFFLKIQALLVYYNTTDEGSKRCLMIWKHAIAILLSEKYVYRINSSLI
jgi:hypothetical protein